MRPRPCRERVTNIEADAVAATVRVNLVGEPGEPVTMTLARVAVDGAQTLNPNSNPKPELDLVEATATLGGGGTGSVIFDVSSENGAKMGGLMGPRKAGAAEGKVN